MTDMSFTKRSNTHYSRGLDPEYMRIFGGKYAEELDGLYGPEGERCGRFPVLVFSGMSGTTHAVSISQAMVTNHGMIYVRKENEQSHGRTCEIHGFEDFEGDETDIDWIFVDDFISSGATAKHVMRTIQKYYVKQINSNRIFQALNDPLEFRVIQLEVAIGHILADDWEEISMHLPLE